MTTAAVDYDIPDPDYRRVPRLSYSGMKRLLDCPARYRWEIDHPQPPKDAFDFGHIVHGIVLGVGEPVAVLDYPDRRTKAYKEAEAEARAAGQIPVLQAVYDDARACADAVLTHPLAGPLFTGTGRSEVSITWTDDNTGVDLKGRIDRVVTLPDDTDILIDFKTVGRSVAPASFARQCAELDYHMQAPVYLDGWHACTGRDAAFLHVAVESGAPHLVLVGQLDDDALDVGRDAYRNAIDLYERCTRTSVWPGYTDTEPTTISLPAWAAYKHRRDQP